MTKRHWKTKATTALQVAKVLRQDYVLWDAGLLVITLAMLAEAFELNDTERHAFIGFVLNGNKPVDGDFPYDPNHVCIGNEIGMAMDD
jgi:hypothetical protein